MILAMIDKAVDAGARREQACEVVGLADRTVERWREADVGDDLRAGPRTRAANAFTPAERAKVLEVVNSSDYRDLPPKQVVPRLADAGRYVGSESTIYRILRDEGQNAHRGRAKPRTVRTVDEHVATAANQVWSWDITYLLSSIRGRFFYLYLVEDVWSRRIVGFEVHEEESMETSAALVRSTCAAERVDPSGLVLHSDNGGPMKGSTMLATPAPARHRRVLQPSERQRRQPLHRVALPHAEVPPRVSAQALRHHRGRARVGDRLRGLVQHRASPQRHPLRDARRASRRSRDRRPREAQRRLRTRAPKEPEPMVARHPQLDARASRLPQPQTRSGDRRRAHSRARRLKQIRKSDNCLDAHRDRGRHVSASAARRARARQARLAVRASDRATCRQRPGVHLDGARRVGLCARREARFHPPRQADAEWSRRELQRPLPRRVSLAVALPDARARSPRPSATSSSVATLSSMRSRVGTITSFRCPFH